MKNLQKEFEILRLHFMEMAYLHNNFLEMKKAFNCGLLDCSPAFFGWIASVLRSHWRTVVCRTLDRKEINGQENITVKNINLQLKNKGKLCPEIETISDNLHEYEKKLRPGRNKIIAHIDKETYLNNTGLGETSMSEDKKFMDNTQKYFNLVATAIGIDADSFNHSEPPYDFHKLLDILKEHYEPQWTPKMDS